MTRHKHENARFFGQSVTPIGTLRLSRKGVHEFIWAALVHRAEVAAQKEICYEQEAGHDLEGCAEEVEFEVGFAGLAQAVGEMEQTSTGVVHEEGEKREDESELLVRQAATKRAVGSVSV